MKLLETKDELFVKIFHFLAKFYFTQRKSQV